MVIGGVAPVESKVRRAGCEGFGGKAVNEIGGSVKAFDPICQRKGGLEQQGVQNVVQRPKSMLSPTILGRCMWARHAERETPFVVKNEWEVEFSNSRPLSH